jgi:hypothetical protein
MGKGHDACVVKQDIHAPEFLQRELHEALTSARFVTSTDLSSAIPRPGGFRL